MKDAMTAKLRELRGCFLDDIGRLIVWDGPKQEGALIFDPRFAGYFNLVDGKIRFDSRPRWRAREAIVQDKLLGLVVDPTPLLPLDKSLHNPELDDGIQRLLAVVRP